MSKSKKPRVQSRRSPISELVPVELPVRLALRETPDGWYVALLADQNSLEDAMEIGRIRMQVMQESNDLFLLYKEFMQKVMNHMVTTVTGIAVEANIERPANDPHTH